MKISTGLVIGAMSAIAVMGGAAQAQDNTMAGNAMGGMMAENSMGGMMAGNDMGGMSHDNSMVMSSGMSMSTMSGGQVIAIMPDGHMGTMTQTDTGKVDSTIQMSKPLDSCVMFITGTDGKIYQVDTSTDAGKKECEAVAL